MKKDPDELLSALARSRFRGRFRLSPADISYIHSKGADTIRTHARRFITERLGPAHPKNDGRQTPVKGHPVFVAQHAVAACCRGCLAKWHGIEKGFALDSASGSRGNSPETHHRAIPTACCLRKIALRQRAWTIQ